METRLDTMLNVADFDKLYSFRKELHQWPELSGQEIETQNRIREFLLENSSPSEIFSIGNTGLAVVFKSNNPGKRILLRCDTDALPIEEINDFEHKSKKAGVSHKCGHDGHSTIMCGIAQMLTKAPIRSGEVVLLFQPAEEIGVGANAVLNDPKFEKIRPDVVYALHNIPSHKLNKIIVREGAFTASVKSLVVKFNGKTAHAAEPEHGFNPAYAIAAILHETRSLINNKVDSADFALITPTHGFFGDDFAYGTAAGYGEIRLTIRTWSVEKMQQFEDRVLEVVTACAMQENVTFSYEWTQIFDANLNNTEAVENIVNAAQSLDLEIEHRNTPFKWGEDFGLFTNLFPGAMFGIGAGLGSSPLHNPDYDFPDEIIPAAAEVFYKIIQKEIG